MATGTRVDWESERGQYAPATASPTLEQRLAQAIERGAQHLLSLQASAGYWVGELEADTTLESDYIY